MKLVEILAKELEEWPEGVCICQDEDKGCYSWTDVPEWGAEQWIITKTAHVVKSIDLTEFAEDYQTAIVTKQMWEAEKAKLNAQNTPVFDPIYCRERIKEIDSLVESLEEERVSLVQALEDEGFALISTALVNADPTENMSDPSNWREGDLVECMTDKWPNVYTLGALYPVIEVNPLKVKDDRGINSCCYLNENDVSHFKFHSRPQ